MSRFVNLEFDREPEGEPAKPQAVKDEAYYLSEARAAFEQGRFEEALRLYAKVLEFGPQSAAAWSGQVRALIELGQYEEARQWADKALETLPHDAELLAAKAVALARSGDLEGAQAFSDASVEERGAAPYVWLARGDVMLARNELQADYSFEKALGLAPKDWFTTWLAARIRYDYEHFAHALRLAQQALEWNPGQSSLWLLAGLCQKQLGLVAAAKRSLTQAQQLNPRCRETRAALRELTGTGLGDRLRGVWRRLRSKP